MLDAAVNKLLHAPTSRIKALAGDPQGDDLVKALHHLFDLQEIVRQVDDAAKRSARHRVRSDAASVADPESAGHEKALRSDERGALVLATRRSALALAQARAFARDLGGAAPRPGRRRAAGGDHRRQDHRCSAVQGRRQGALHQGDRRGARLAKKPTSRCTRSRTYRPSSPTSSDRLRSSSRRRARRPGIPDRAPSWRAACRRARRHLEPAPGAYNSARRDPTS